MQRHNRRHSNKINGHVVSTSRLHYPTSNQRYRVQGLIVLHEFDDFGNHRIIVDQRASEWANYKNLTQLSMGTGKVAATTDFWIGTLPRVFLYLSE